MRMEKGFPGAGELTNEVTLPEANVMRFVPRWTKSTSASKPRDARGVSRRSALDLRLSRDRAGWRLSDGHGGEAVSAWAARSSGPPPLSPTGTRSARSWPLPTSSREAAAVPGTEDRGDRRTATPRGRVKVLGEPAYDPASASLPMLADRRPAQ